MDKRITGLYVLYDRVAQRIGPVMEQETDAIAARATARLIVKNHLDPKEYEIWRIGLLDVSTGHISADLQVIPYEIEYNKAIFTAKLYQGVAQGKHEQEVE